LSFVKFLTAGIVKIHAQSESVKSVELMFNVMDEQGNSTVRMGSFVGIGGHTVTGDVTLKISGNDLILTFASNFFSESGPDLYVTLAKNKSSYSSGDKEVVFLGTNTSGAKSFTITNTDINAFNYIHIWCKLHGPVFGSAELNNTMSSSSKMGSIVSISHGTSHKGTITLTEVTGGLTLSFGSDFQTVSGPDLVVTLSASASTYQSSDKVIASLKSISGSQMYAVTGVDLSDYQYVQVWCRQANSVFCSAKLN
jgi:hypothetical protein